MEKKITKEMLDAIQEICNEKSRLSWEARAKVVANENAGIVDHDAEREEKKLNEEFSILGDAIMILGHYKGE